MSKAKELSPLKVLARRIDAHLKRFEADPVINAERPQGGMMLAPYYQPCAWHGYRGIAIRYIDFQGTSHLSKAEAERYADLLDGGFVGRHTQMPAAGTGERAG